jgi:hypothetical protein
VEIRFRQARNEINPGLFKRIDNLRRDFPFHVSSWRVQHRSLPFNTEASGLIQEAKGTMAVGLITAMLSRQILAEYLRGAELPKICAFRRKDQRISRRRSSIYGSGQAKEAFARPLGRFGMYRKFDFLFFLIVREDRKQFCACRFPFRQTSALSSWATYASPRRVFQNRPSR